MKKILLASLALASVAVILTGCTTNHVSKYSAPLDIKVEAQAKPTVQVGGLINGEAKLQRVLFFTWGASKFADCVDYGGPSGGQETGFQLFGISFDAGKAAAAYNACDKADADVIVAPKYEIEYKNYVVYAVAKIKVQGYKGNFKGLKK